MRVENKRLYAFLACIFDENSHTCPTRTRMKQSGVTLSRQIRLNKAAVRFFWHTRSEIKSRKLSRRLAMRAAISAWQTPEEIPERYFSSSKRSASVLLNLNCESNRHLV